MMTEQQLQEMENSIGLIDCPDCEQGRVSREGTFEDGQEYDRCETCDGSGMVSRFPAGHALIAEVRRLQQEKADAYALVTRTAQQRDAALAERDEWKANYNHLGDRFNGITADLVTAQQKAAEAQGRYGVASMALQIKQLQAALTEARRVLREQAYPLIDAIMRGRRYDADDVFRAHAEIAAVLAQEEPHG